MRYSHGTHAACKCCTALFVAHSSSGYVPWAMSLLRRYSRRSYSLARRTRATSSARSTVDWRRISESHRRSSDVRCLRSSKASWWAFCLSARRRRCRSARSSALIFASSSRWRRADDVRMRRWLLSASRSHRRASSSADVRSIFCARRALSSAASCCARSWLARTWSSCTSPASVRRSISSATRASHSCAVASVCSTVFSWCARLLARCDAARCRASDSDSSWRSPRA
mmetsp:Transcript_15362/g.47569  ORF Transcript_15362/g.47569 Transcript_15362/m.47569 type:complete len:228 (-) Transcript_15362:19-702(-)